MGAGSCKTPTPALVGSLSTWTWVSMGVSGHGAVGSGHRAAIQEFGVENPFDSLLASLCSSRCAKQRALDIPNASLCSDIPQAPGVLGWAPRGFGVPDGAPSNVPPPSLDVDGGNQPGWALGAVTQGAVNFTLPWARAGFSPRWLFAHTFSVAGWFLRKVRQGHGGVHVHRGRFPNEMPALAGEAASWERSAPQTRNPNRMVRLPPRTSLGAACPRGLGPMVAPGPVPRVSEQGARPRATLQLLGRLHRGGSASSP